MKKQLYDLCFFLIFFNLFLLGNAQNKNNIVSIKGVVKNFTNQIQVEDMSEIGSLTLPNSDRTFLPDSAGCFSISFHVFSPNYFRIGRNILYVTPGSNDSVFIDYDFPDKAHFKGTNAFANDYLKNTPFPKGGSFLGSGNNIKATIRETVDAILILASQREKLLLSYSNISNQFKKLELARIRADIINSLQKINSYYFEENKINKDSVSIVKEECKRLTIPYIKKYAQKFIAAEYLKLVVYREILGKIVEENTSKVSFKDSVMCSDWLIARHLFYKINEENAKSQAVNFKEEAKKISTIVYRNLIENKISALLKFGKGDIAKDLIAFDKNDHPVHLNEFKGKVIYIDIWATWCGPCMKELPFLDKLKESFSNNENIVFLSLSIDEDKEAWKQSLLKRNANGLQLIISKDKLQQYFVVGIPRVIIINKGFQIEEMNGVQPSDNSSKSYLTSLVK